MPSPGWREKPVNTPKPATLNTWLFPPQTREVQLDEKWSFVAKKEKHCDRDEVADNDKGDQWDHTAIDPESRLILSVIPGRRTLASCLALVQAVKDKTEGRTDLFLTSDEHASYETAIAKVYQAPEPTSTDQPTDDSTAPKEKSPSDLCYATVRKTRKQGRVIEIVTAIVIGVVSLLAGYLKRSRVSHTINTSFVERQNGTDRCQNSRKRRKTYGFSKKLDVHQAMAAGLTDHIWSIEEWVTYPMIMNS